MPERKPISPGRRRPSIRSLLLAVALTLALLAVRGLLAIRQADMEQEPGQKQPPTPQARQIERQSLRPDRAPGS